MRQSKLEEKLHKENQERARQSDYSAMQKAPTPRTWSATHRPDYSGNRK